MGRDYHVYSKTAKRPRRPYEWERLDREIKLVGEYGLRNKREVWRVNYTLSRVRSIARTLLTLDEKDPKRIFEGTALIRRLVRMGVLSENEQRLDSVLGLTIEKFLDRRLQTRVFQGSLAKSIHHARCLIRQRHIRVGKRLVNIPSFMVRVESEKHIEFALDAPPPLGSGRPGRVKRKSLKNKASKKGEAAASGDAAGDDDKKTGGAAKKDDAEEEV